DLARAALERFQSFTRLAESYTAQVDDQKQQVDTLRRALDQLEGKLAEARASDAQLAIGGVGPAAGFDRMERKVQRGEAVSQAKASMVADDVDRRFEAMAKDDEIGRLLDALKARRAQ